MKYTINELANSKGVSPLVREALLQMEAAIKQALAAPVQEPDHGDELTIAYMSGLHDGKKKRQWVGLTVDELITLEQKHMRHEDLSRAIEAKLRSKNT